MKTHRRNSFRKQSVLNRLYPSCPDMTIRPDSCRDIRFDYC